MATSTLTRKGQTTIPREVRERLGLKAGDRIAYIQDDHGSTVMVPVRRYGWRDLRGIVPAPDKPVTLEEIEEAIVEGGGRARDALLGVDTNVLLRLIVDDDPEQALRADRFVEAAVGRGEVLYVAKVVLCELVWVLGHRYRASRTEVITAIERVLGSETFQVEEEASALEALELYRSGRCDFADGIIGAGNRRAGCTGTATFDRKATRLELFVEL